MCHPVTGFLQDATVRKQFSCLVATLWMAVATQKLLEARKRSQRTIQKLQSCDGSSAASPCAQVIQAVLEGAGERVAEAKANTLKGCEKGHHGGFNR